MRNDTGSGTPRRQRAVHRNGAHPLRSHGHRSATDENVEIDNLADQCYSAAETLNGGLGNDTYSFGLGDGNDIDQRSRQRHQRRIGRSDLDPGAEHRHRSGDLPADPDDHGA